MFETLNHVSLSEGLGLRRPDQRPTSSRRHAVLLVPLLVPLLGRNRSLVVAFMPGIMLRQTEPAPAFPTTAIALLSTVMTGAVACSRPSPSSRRSWPPYPRTAARWSPTSTGHAPPAAYCSPAPEFDRRGGLDNMSQAVARADAELLAVGTRRERRAARPRFPRSERGAARELADVFPFMDAETCSRAAASR